MNPNFFSLSDNAIALLLEAAKVAFPEKVVTFTTATLDGYRTYLFHFFEAKKDTVILSWIELATAYLYMIKEGLPVKEEIDEEQLQELCDSFANYATVKEYLTKKRK